MLASDMKCTFLLGRSKSGCAGGSRVVSEHEPHRSVRLAHATAAPVHASAVVPHAAHCASVSSRDELIRSAAMSFCASSCAVIIV